MADRTEITRWNSRLWNTSHSRVNCELTASTVGCALFHGAFRRASIEDTFLLWGPS